MSIVFSKGGLSDLTLERGRLYPITNPVKINQHRYLTEDYSPKVVNWGSSYTLFDLKFNYLSKSNYDDATDGLKTWFESSAINYSESNFTLTDENGVTHTVRLWQDRLDFTEHASERYAISLILFKEA